MYDGENGGRFGHEENELYRRPGFLIRRAHQIAVSLFLEELGDFNITATQYGAMVTLRSNPGLDQVGLGKLVGIDRCTAALVATNLEQAGYVRRAIDPADRRRKILILTANGHETLEQIAAPARRAQEREMSIFTPRQAEVFLDLLTRFVTAFNDEARAPIVSASGDAAGRKTQRRHRAMVRRRLTVSRASARPTP